jgi:hypothetical protein
MALERSFKPQKNFLILILIAITIVEYIFVYTNVAYGIVLSLVLVVAIYVTVSMPREENDVTKAAETLAIVPLYILFTSSLPWFFIEQEYLLPAAYSIVLALVFFHVYDKNIDLRSLGLTFSGAWKWILICSLIAIPTGTIEYYVLRPEPSLPSFEVKYLLRDFLYMLLFVGVAEELLFRGLIQTDLQRVFGMRNGLLLASYLFGVMHMTWRSSAELLFTFFAAILIGYIYNRSRNLMGPIFLHGVNNTVLVGVLPYVLR